MLRIRIKCPYCNRRVSRNNFIETPVETEQGSLQGRYWCVNCQKEFKGTFAKEDMFISYTQDGYTLVKVPGYGWMREHIYIWEQANGKLPKGYLVHHIDGDKANNNIKNLIAIPKKSHCPNLSSCNKKNNIH